MSKAVPFILITLVLFAVLAAVNIHRATAEEDIRIIQISVLSKNQADYRVDENINTIPAVSEDIIEDTARDIQQESSVPIIKYTSLPVETQDSTDQANDSAAAVEKPKDKDKPENKGNDNPNQQGDGNQDQDNNGHPSPHPNPGNENDHKNNGQENKPDKDGASNGSDKIK